MYRVASFCFLFFFIFACFRRVLRLIFVSFSLFFLACLKTELCLLCTSMFTLGNIMIW